MTRRPLALTLFATAMLIVCFSIPLQAGWLQDIDHLTQSLTWLNILVMILCASLAWATLKAHWSVRLLLPVTVMTVIFNNWWVGHVSLDFSMAQASFASFGFVSLSGILLQKEALEVLRNPKLKWWDRSPRGQIEIPVILSPWLRGTALHKKSFDLSDTGLFVQNLLEEEFLSLKLGERFEVRLLLEGQCEIHCTALLVRKTTGAGVYPQGVGLAFEGLGASEKNSLKKFSCKPSEHETFH